MGGRNLTITDSSIVTGYTRNDKQLYAVRFEQKMRQQHPLFWISSLQFNIGVE